MFFRTKILNKVQNFNFNNTNRIYQILVNDKNKANYVLKSMFRIEPLELPMRPHSNQIVLKATSHGIFNKYQAHVMFDDYYRQIKQIKVFDDHNLYLMVSYDDKTDEDVECIFSTFV